MTTVLVTGVGAIIGYGVLKSLRKAHPAVKLIGADIYSDAVGQRWCDKFYQVPLTSDEAYRLRISDIIRSEKVDLLIPGIEQDSQYFSRCRHIFTGVQICVNEDALVEIASDKWVSFQEISSFYPGICIPTFIEGSFEELAVACGLPFLAKPRRGYASKGLVRITNREVFDRLGDRFGERFVIQPIVGSDDEEYTIAIFGDGRGNSLASIILQRRLAPDGSTLKAEVRNDLCLDAVLSPLISRLKPVGPTNIQLRRADGEWKLLEINPRISSSTSIRAAFGYNEASMALDFFLYGKTVTQPQISSGKAVRYIEDAIFP